MNKLIPKQSLFTVQNGTDGAYDTFDVVCNVTSLRIASFGYWENKAEAERMANTLARSLTKLHWHGFHHMDAWNRSYEEINKYFTSPTSKGNSTMTTHTKPQTLFEFGELHIDAAALASFKLRDIFLALIRYQNGDWGDATEIEAEYNELGVKADDEIFARYAIGENVLVVTTDALRTVTHVHGNY